MPWAMARCRVSLGGLHDHRVKDPASSLIAAAMFAGAAALVMIELKQAGSTPRTPRSASFS